MDTAEEAGINPAVGLILLAVVSLGLSITAFIAMRRRQARLRQQAAGPRTSPAAVASATV